MLQGDVVVDGLFTNRSSSDEECVAPECLAIFMRLIYLKPPSVLNDWYGIFPPFHEPQLGTHQGQKPQGFTGTMSPSDFVDVFNQKEWMFWKTNPINPCIVGIFTYIWLIFMVNVGKCTIHGCYGKHSLSNLPHILQL